MFAADVRPRLVRRARRRWPHLPSARARRGPQLGGAGRPRPVQPRLRGLFPDLVRALDAADPQRPAPRTAAYLRRAEGSRADARSTACSSCSTPRTASSCRCATSATTTTACARCANEIAAAASSRTTPSRPRIATTRPACAACSAPSTRASPPSACRPTMAACSIRRPRRCWSASSCPTPLWRRSSIALSPRARGRQALDQLPRPLASSSSARSTSACWSTRWWRRTARVEVADDEAGRARARGSFYTPEVLVQLILERAVGPLVTERLASAFAQRAEALAERRGAEGRAPRRALPPRSRDSRCSTSRSATRPWARAISWSALVDYLADRVLRGRGRSAAAGAVRRRRIPYVSPLVERIAAIRDRILGHAADARLERRRGPARRPAPRPPHDPQARRPRRRQEPDGGRAGQGRALAAHLHGRRAALLPRPSPALRRQPARACGSATSTAGCSSAAPDRSTGTSSAAQQAAGSMVQIEAITDSDIAEVEPTAPRPSPTCASRRSRWPRFFRFLRPSG